MVSVELAALVMGGSVDMGGYVVIDDKGGEGELEVVFEVELDVVVSDLKI